MNSPMKCLSLLTTVTVLVACLVPALPAHGKEVALTDAQVVNLVRRSYHYVAMYNIIHKFALKFGDRWNACVADTQLKDHTTREIARPNNDTLYITCLVDVRRDPLILEMPAFDSKYVSLMITAYDHYVNIPMATSQGDFGKPAKMLIYSARTEGYDGKPVEGVDRHFEATGDFVSVVFRVMPHANEPERFKRIITQMQSVKLVTLSEYRGGKAKPINDIKFPPVGKTDADIFGNNLLQVMQFVFNHTTFDPKDKLDQAVLAAYKPLGVVPGRKFDTTKVAAIDGARFRNTTEQIAKQILASTSTPEFRKKLFTVFLPKGQMILDVLLDQSVIGPIGMPASQALYPTIETVDGKPMNAMHDYVIRMAAKDLPPAKTFWSVTLYDLKNGFFIPNERKKYSVGENAGMKLNKDGGIEIYIAADKPEGVPEENWLPIERKDEAIDAILRLYIPDMEKMKTWQTPKAEMLKK
ncbi:MAG: DUF1214 domain-containing protein [Nitrospira sp.]|jgi:hypothetical protein|nr:DUF1214 domain-containing protein [Nitrospira sp.]MDH4358135.1 DUF1214 domain-containing protein [Nitrospira sp.]MDH5320463.1 DUF1214 domain-containing protein [Nitrospira sp.]